MKRAILAVMLGSGFLFTANASFAGHGKACQFSDVGKLKDHLAKHVMYPAKGADIKKACNKEMPDEFTKAEKSCVAHKLKDKTEYKSADEVLAAIGVQ